MKFTPDQVNEIIRNHHKWLVDWRNREPLSPQRANFNYSDLYEPGSFVGANLPHSLFIGADLRGSNFSYANLSGANFKTADLSDCNFYQANLSYANLAYANLGGADLTCAILVEALLDESDLTNVRGLRKVMGVAPGNIYWKRLGVGLKNRGYQFRVGRNDLPPGQVFASDERVLCSRPGFHFASRSWCALNSPNRPLEARIRIPEDAQINEPWATDGKASASAIEILQVFSVETGKDVTEAFRDR